MVRIDRARRDKVAVGRSAEDYVRGKREDGKQSKSDATRERDETEFDACNAEV